MHIVHPWRACQVLDPIMSYALCHSLIINSTALPFLMSQNTLMFKIKNIFKKEKKAFCGPDSGLVHELKGGGWETLEVISSANPHTTSAMKRKVFGTRRKPLWQLQDTYQTQKCCFLPSWTECICCHYCPFREVHTQKILLLSVIIFSTLLVR